MIVTVRYRGTFANLQMALARAVKKASRDRRVLAAVGEATLSVIHESFLKKEDGSADAAGLKWSPLAEPTVRKKGNDAILVEEGDLQASLKPSKGQKPKYQVFRIRKNFWEGGTRRPFALAQHRGIPGRLPQRRLWAELRMWPREWWKRIAAAATVEVVNVILRELRGGK